MDEQRLAFSRHKRKGMFSFPISPVRLANLEHWFFAHYNVMHCS